MTHKVVVFVTEMSIMKETSGQLLTLSLEPLAAEVWFCPVFRQYTLARTVGCCVVSSKVIHYSHHNIHTWL
jgi:hypothetical protein